MRAFRGTRPGSDGVDHLIVTAAPATGVTDRGFFDGLFDTASWADMPAQRREQFFADATANLLAGRPATPEDFGDAVIGLLTARSITGQVVVVDGGAAVGG